MTYLPSTYISTVCRVIIWRERWCIEPEYVFYCHRKLCYCWLRCRYFQHKLPKQLVCHPLTIYKWLDHSLEEGSARESLEMRSVSTAASWLLFATESVWMGNWKTRICGMEMGNGNGNGNEKPYSRQESQISHELAPYILQSVNLYQGDIAASSSWSRELLCIDWVAAR